MFSALSGNQHKHFSKWHGQHAALWHWSEEPCDVVVMGDGDDWGEGIKMMKDDVMREPAECQSTKAPTWESPDCHKAFRHGCTMYLSPDFEPALWQGMPLSTPWLQTHLLSTAGSRRGCQEKGAFKCERSYGWAHKNRSGGVVSMQLEIFAWPGDFFMVSLSHYHIFLLLKYWRKLYKN